MAHYIFYIKLNSLRGDSRCLNKKIIYTQQKKTFIKLMKLKQNDKLIYR